MLSEASEALFSCDWGLVRGLGQSQRAGFTQ